MKRSYRGILRARALVGPVLVAALCVSASAQQPTTPPATDSPDPAALPPANQPLPPVNQPLPPQQGTANRAPDPTTESHNRVFYVLPNYLTVDNAQNVPPLTTGQKFKLNAKDCFDIGILLWYAGLAGISQASNTDAVYGQGTAGYARRYAVRFADGTIEDFMTRAVFPSLLHQDPRYFRLGRGSVGHRTVYALTRIVITRGDNGDRQFNYSELAGSGVAAGISISYRPAEQRTVSNTMSIWGSQVGYDALAFLIREFWPDIRQKLHKSKHTP
jgi:hypothetical protein